ncbi:helix-turn-helix transcriptional regulator, partial [Variovorax defluvii]
EGLAAASATSALPHVLRLDTLALRQQVGTTGHPGHPMDVPQQHWTQLRKLKRWCHMRAHTDASSQRLAADNAAQRDLQAAAHLLEEALTLLRADSTLLVTHTTKRAPDRLLRLPEVERLTGLRRSAIYEQMQRGVFPRSVKAGRRTATWPESAIQSWIADRLDGRPA